MKVFSILLTSLLSMHVHAEVPCLPQINEALSFLSADTVKNNNYVFNDLNGNWINLDQLDKKSIQSFAEENKERYRSDIESQYEGIRSLVGLLPQHLQNKLRSILAMRYDSHDVLTLEQSINRAKVAEVYQALYYSLGPKLCTKSQPALNTEAAIARLQSAEIECRKTECSEQVLANITSQLKRYTDYLETTHSEIDSDCPQRKQRFESALEEFRVKHFQYNPARKQGSNSIVPAKNKTISERKSNYDVCAYSFHGALTTIIG